MQKINGKINRRSFVATGALLVSGILIAGQSSLYAKGIGADRPGGSLALTPSHFPSRLHAFIWRNWSLVPIHRMAETVKASEAQIYKIAKWMGLPDVADISADQWDRSYLTVIRRNWHLLPKEQLLVLMGWTHEQLEFTLVEDDFFYVKLGNLKPECDPIYWNQYLQIPKESLDGFKTLLHKTFPVGIPKQKEPYFHFVTELSQQTVQKGKMGKGHSGFSPRIAYPYFALFGDPLLESSTDSYPDAYLEKMHGSGVDSIWMHIVLSKITPFPWDPSISRHWEKRLENLQKLVLRAKQKGIGIYLYLNEPRHQPTAFFSKHPHLKGSGNALCTSHPEVQVYLENALAIISERIPALAGFFSITASENPTNCWSHGAGDSCSRCGKKGAAEVIAQLNGMYAKGIKKGFEKSMNGQPQKNAAPPNLIIWDWGWRDGLAEQILPALPKERLAFMSVSEWDLEIERGGVKSKVGEYSISSIGPGPRAKRHWQIARDLGIPCIAKIQANNTWELGAVPYIPALFNIGQHIENLRKSGVSGLMLGWTLGGYPSPNLELVSLMGARQELSAAEAIQMVAHGRYGPGANAIVKAWKSFSTAFSQFPYHIGVVYRAPLQAGPSNLLWEKPTGYQATMVGLPYDDLNSWRSIYSEEIFILQLERVANGFFNAIAVLKKEIRGLALSALQFKQIQGELRIAETLGLHYKSIVHQSKFVQNRRLFLEHREPNSTTKQELQNLLNAEIDVAQKMAALQSGDSRLGYEASNHYFYVAQDLYEKMLNCQYLKKVYG